MLPRKRRVATGILVALLVAFTFVSVQQGWSQVEPLGGQPKAARPTLVERPDVRPTPTKAKRKRKTPAPPADDGAGDEATPKPSGGRWSVPPLGSIDSPLAKLTPGGAITGWKQIHHGIYRVEDAGSKVLFALKTECRPAAKWHGQQGWPEIAVASFSRLLFEHRTTVPHAVGMYVELTPAQLKEMHRDRCGQVNETRAIGVALEWHPRHDDGALPQRSEAVHWTPASDAKLSDAFVKAPNGRRKLQEISDIFVLDYLLGNEDREDKNWFLDEKGHYIAMDNGWAFAGRGYEDSICSDQSVLLRCPPLLRYLSKSSKCKGVVNCRFRATTIERVKDLADKWEKGLGPEWIDVVADDLLLRYLLNNYNTFKTTKRKNGKSLTYSMALARYIQGCPSLEPSPAELMQFLQDGVGTRMKALLSHVKQCAATYGDDSVLL